MAVTKDGIYNQLQVLESKVAAGTSDTLGSVSVLKIKVASVENGVAETLKEAEATAYEISKMHTDVQALRKDLDSFRKETEGTLASIAATMLLLVQQVKALQLSAAPVQ